MPIVCILLRLCRHSEIKANYTLACYLLELLEGVGWFFKASRVLTDCSRTLINVYRSWLEAGTLITGVVASATTRKLLQILWRI